MGRGILLPGNNARWGGIMGCRVLVSPPPVAFFGEVIAEDLVLGFMRYGQVRRVRTYPNFREEAWHLLLRSTQDAVPSLMPVRKRFEFVPFKDEFGDCYLVLKEYERVEKMLVALALLDPITGRMRLNLNGQCGVRIADSYRDLFDVMYILAARINGFYDLG